MIEPPRQSTNYHFLREEKGQLLLLLSLPPATPDHPRIFYDGGPHALFCRTPDDVHLLPDIPAEIGPYLAIADTLLVMEQEAQSQPYRALCHFQQDIPALSALRAG